MAVGIMQIERIWREREIIFVLHCNFRSIRKNLDHPLVYLSLHFFFYDVIAIMQKWLKENETAEVPGYAMASLRRSCASCGGGVSLFVKKLITSASRIVHVVSSLSKLFVHLRCVLNIGVVYRPSNPSIKKFLLDMETVINPLIFLMPQLLYAVTSILTFFMMDVLSANSCFLFSHLTLKMLLVLLLEQRRNLQPLLIISTVTTK